MSGVERTGLGRSILSLSPREIMTRDLGRRYITEHIRRSRAKSVDTMARLAAQRMDDIRHNSNDFLGAENMARVYTQVANNLFKGDLPAVEQFLAQIISAKIKSGENRGDFLRGVVQTFSLGEQQRAGVLLAGIMLQLHPQEYYRCANFYWREISPGPETARDEFLFGMASRFYPEDQLLGQKDLTLKMLKTYGFWDPQMIKSAKERNAKAGPPAVKVISTEGEVRLVRLLEPADAGKKLVAKNLEFLAGLGIAITDQLRLWIGNKQYPTIIKFFENEDFSCFGIAEHPEKCGEILDEQLLAKGYVFSSVDKQRYYTKINCDIMLWFKFGEVESDLGPILGGAKYVLDILAQYDPW